MKILRLRSCLALAITLMPFATSFAQLSTPQSRFLAARALYYNPTASGLRSFGCNVTVDWHEFLKSATGAEIAKDNSLLLYLSSVRMSVKDDLRGSGKLDWANTTTPPDALQDPAKKMQDGLEQMFQGFFQSWNAYLNGSMVPIPDDTTALTTSNGGIHLHAALKTTSVDEDFDNTMLLTKAHVTTGDMDVVATPVFLDTPDGRVVSEIHNEVRAPVTAPPMFVNIFVTYHPIAGYRIPDSVRYEIKNVLDMSFRLTDCSTAAQVTGSTAAEKSPN